MSDKKWSETPRTDAATSWDHERYVDERGQVASVKVVRAAFAGQLERELAEANAGFGRLTKLADQVSDTCKRAENAERALRLARAALHQWTKKYAHLQNECGERASRTLDHNLPPADHLRALEAIEEHFRPGPYATTTSDGSDRHDA